MPNHRMYSLTILLALPLAALADPGIRLEADADPVQVSITPIADERKSLRLPALQFQVGIRAICPYDDSAESLSISVADSRRTLQGEALQDSRELVVELEVPANQVAAVRVDGFCSSGNDSAREMLVRDALTAHLSLRCSGEDGESITYATRPLSIALTCEADSQSDAESSILR